MRRRDKEEKSDISWILFFIFATSQDQSTTEKSFVESLLRRIKRLIQFVPVN